MRLFIAVNFNDDIKAELYHSIKALSASVRSGSYAAIDNFHLAVVFIGETDRVDAVKSIVAGIDSPSFDLHTAGAGFFGSAAEKPVWLGFANSAGLQNIHTYLCDGRRNSGFLYRRTSFQAAFDFRPSGGGLCYFSGKKNAPRITAHIDRVSLMRSDRSGGRPLYTEIYYKKSV